MVYLDRDDYEELLDILQELADEYGICIKGIISESVDDMNDGICLGFFCKPYYEDESNDNDLAEEEQEEPDLIRETEELWDLYHCYAEDEGIIF